jgi:UDP-N-acetylglucosamine enolpyruvyl transferase
LHNVPQLRDIAGMTTVLQSLGVLVYRDAAGTMLVDASQVTPPSPPSRRVQRACFGNNLRTTWA